MYTLSEEFYPKDWKDDQRMGMLLAEFRTKSLNPENYGAKLKFWREMICKYCLEHKQSSNVTLSELKEVFKRNGTKPYCLETVLEEMTNAGEIQTKQEFLMPPPGSLAEWAVNSLVKRPLRWGFNKVKDTLWKVKDENTELLILNVLKTQSEQLLKLSIKSSQSNSLVTMEEVSALAQENQISPEGLHLALQNLANQRLVTIESIDIAVDEDQPKKTLLKFAGPNSSEAQPITEIEKSIYTLEQTEHSLIVVIDEIEDNINQQQTKVKEALAEGKKQVAKQYLRKRHALDKNLEKRSAILENVQTMLHRIHDTQSDKEVVDAYKMGSNALKKAFAQSGLTIDNVEDTIAEMREVLDMHTDIQTVITEPLSPTTNLDDMELEQELKDLLASTKPPSPETEKAVGLNDVDFDEEIERRLRGLKFDVPSLETENRGNKNISNSQI